MLEANPNTKFITQVHVFWGYNYFQGQELFWYENFTDTLLEIVSPYIDNHILSIGAHIHHINIFAAKSSKVPNIELIQVINPSVTPVYNNNPGFGLLTLNDDYTVKDFKFTFLQLEDYHRYGVFNYEVYDPTLQSGIDFNDAQTVRNW